jgi:hypothetical protein
MIMRQNCSSYLASHDRIPGVYLRLDPKPRHEHSMSIRLKLEMSILEVTKMISLMCKDPKKPPGLIICGKGTSCGSNGVISDPFLLTV